MTRKARYLCTAAVALAGVVVLGGCKLDSGGGATGGSAAATQGPAKPATEVKVDKAYWHRGFKVTLGTAKIVEGSHTPKAVTIEATFQNLSPEHDGQPTSSALLTVGSRTYSEVDNPLTKLPEVPAQRSQPGA